MLVDTKRLRLSRQKAAKSKLLSPREIVSTIKKKRYVSDPTTNTFTGHALSHPTQRPYVNVFTSIFRRVSTLPSYRWPWVVTSVLIERVISRWSRGHSTVNDNRARTRATDKLNIHDISSPHTAAERKLLADCIRARSDRDHPSPLIDQAVLNRARTFFACRRWRIKR